MLFETAQTRPAVFSPDKYPAFFEKGMGGPGGRGKTFFPVKKSFSPPPDSLFHAAAVFAAEIGGGFAALFADERTEV